MRRRAAGAGWSRGLAPWYRRQGRHDLPWRHTRDPWAVLVSEVMLQQTQVPRVLPRWHSFLSRWPTAQACAAAPLPDVLREWQGLGYPRRALALHRTAQIVAHAGWPQDEAGLRALPGVGGYTARALMGLAFEWEAPLPRDVNIGRVVGRAALAGGEGARRQATLQAALELGRPPGLSRRDYTLALFDVGALHCRAEPRCGGCPLARGCAWRRSGSVGGAPAAPAPRRQAPYRGSLRALRGAVLRAMLAPSPPASPRELVIACGAGAEERVRLALAGLVSEGLLPPVRWPGWA